MNVRAVIFDLGGVILNLDYLKSEQAFRNLIPEFNGSRFCGSRDQASFYDAFETGIIDSTQFLQSFNQDSGGDLSEAELRHCWNAMLLDLPIERIALIDGLKKAGTRTFLLSNINPIHAEAFHELYQALGLNHPFEACFEKVYFSHEIGLRKPDPAAFQLILREHALDPATTLFIDDSAQHVEGARSLGLQVHHLVPPETLLDLFPHAKP